MMFVDIGSLILELIQVECGLVNEMSDLTSHDLIVVQGTPKDKGILGVVHKLETGLI